MVGWVGWDGWVGWVICIVCIAVGRHELGCTSNMNKDNWEDKNNWEEILKDWRQSSIGEGTISNNFKQFQKKTRTVSNNFQQFQTILKLQL
jgi:hypothetical protein